MSRKAHWEQVYRERQPNDVSWYAPHLDRSLEMIRGAAQPDSAIMDVGGGASTLVDDLLELGYAQIAVLDISAAALAVAQARLGERAIGVRWVVADVVDGDAEDAPVDLWHDRAVFHFLTQPAHRRRYVERATRCVRPGGHLLVSTFSLEGPDRCSGLDVIRYSPESLVTEFGACFRLVETACDVHRTPFGTDQHFVTCLFKRLSPGA